MKVLAGTVLVVDDTAALAGDLVRLLERAGLAASAAGSCADARVEMRRLDPDVALLDLQLPDGDGVSLLAELSQEHPDTRFVVITGHGSIRSAVEATRHGAIDYLTKPFEPEVLLVAVDKALRERALSDEVRRLRARHIGPAAQSPSDERARSPAMLRVEVLIERAARHDGIVLLLGESGVGKDHLARRLHRRSARGGGPFFSINCSALPRELAEAELFGHEPGAFTGARGRKRGLLELAQGGTLLLNEIGELELPLQAKLLTFLDTRAFVRVGGERSIAIDARLIAATNRDLAAEVAAGRFRQDLYYRINVFPIVIPPLRDRREDLPELVATLLERLVRDLGLAATPSVAPDVLDALACYSWPGNIRELRNVLERAVILADDHTVRRAQLEIAGDEGQWRHTVRFDPTRSLHDITRDAARALVSEALRRAPTRQEAARLLGISRHALTHQIKALGLDD
jgi:DNA-binding NtrC family response regulator